MTQLNNANLTEIASKGISTPTFNREQVKSRIAHIGVGNFHRAHQSFMCHQLLENHGVTDCCIVGIGLLPGDRRSRDALQRQDYLFSLLEKRPDGKTMPQILGALKDFILAVENHIAVIEQLAHEDIAVVSLTITEGGYNFDSYGEFDFTNNDVIHDLAERDHPKSVFGYLTAALRRRRERGIPAFTLMSCDNIQHNGDVLKKMLLSFAERQDPTLAKWIEDYVRFPNSMVDRITPYTSPADVAVLTEEYGIADEWPVTCEPFIQWVIEDKFVDWKPPFDLAGAQFVADVGPFEKMKLRLLNAGHSVLGVLGALQGYKTIDECVADPTFARFLRHYMDVEVTPSLDRLPGIDLEEYKDNLLLRFSNPNIKDSVTRICSESSAKIPKFILPTLRDNLTRGGSIDCATFVLAAWCYYSGKRINRISEPLEIIDALGEQLQASANHTGEDPLTFVKLVSVFGDLTDDLTFCEKYTEYVQLIYQGADIQSLMDKLTPSLEELSF